MKMVGPEDQPTGASKTQLGKTPWRGSVEENRQTNNKNTRQKDKQTDNKTNNQEEKLGGLGPQEPSRQMEVPWSKCHSAEPNHTGSADCSTQNPPRKQRETNKQNKQTTDK